MTKNDIARMAREAGMHDPMIFIFAYTRFAALVAAAEREACAKVCESMNADYDSAIVAGCAEAIRARGNT